MSIVFHLLPQLWVGNDGKQHLLTVDQVFSRIPADSPNRQVIVTSEKIGVKRRNGAIKETNKLINKNAAVANVECLKGIMNQEDFKCFKFWRQGEHRGVNYWGLWSGNPEGYGTKSGHITARYTSTGFESWSLESKWYDRPKIVLPWNRTSKVDRANMFLGVPHGAAKALMAPGKTWHARGQFKTITDSCGYTATWIGSSNSSGTGGSKDNSFDDFLFVDLEDDEVFGSDNSFGSESYDSSSKDARIAELEARLAAATKGDSNPIDDNLEDEDSEDLDSVDDEFED